MSKLKEYCLRITDGEHGTVIDDPLGECYLLSNKNIIDGEIIITDADRKINRSTLEKINKRTQISIGCVLIATVGTVGKTAVIRNTPNYAMQRSVGIIQPNPELLDADYLKYYLDSPIMQKRINNSVKGAVQKCLFIGDIEDLDVDIPTLSEQKRIVQVLGEIDGLINNNNSICSDLEAMAKQLYDYWFVQFDFPDENGKPYKSSGGKMVWNEELKREIPEGWEAKPILDLCQVIDCLHSKKPEFKYEDELCYLLSLENITPEGYIDVANKYYISRSDFATWTQKITVKENDFVVTNAGRAGAIGKIPNGIECAIGRNITAIRPERIDPYYLRQFFKSNYFTEQVLSNLDQGSFFMSFNVHSIKKLKLLIPSEPVYKDFIEKIRPVIFSIERNNAENQQLASLRDFLLPMLMNGQVKVGKAGA